MTFKEFLVENRIYILETSKRSLINFKSILTESSSNDMLDRIKKRYKIETVEGNSLGYSPTDEKWYGWSHRAIYGFGIGSKVCLGDCGYNPSNKEEFLNSIKDWYKDKMYSNLKITPESKGIRIEYTIIPIKPNKDSVMVSTKTFEEYPKKFGRGEWTAKTLDDAKLMAKDFADSVS